MSVAASGDHISPVSPNPCSSSTAVPVPPTRTCNVVPLVAISLDWNPRGNGSTRAMAGVERMSVTKANERYPLIPIPHRATFNACTITSRSATGACRSLYGPFLLLATEVERDSQPPHEPTPVYLRFGAIRVVEHLPLHLYVRGLRNS